MFAIIVVVGFTDRTSGVMTEIAQVKSPDSSKGIHSRLVSTDFLLEGHVGITLLLKMPPLPNRSFD